MPKQLLIHSSLVHMEHSQESNIYWDTEIASTKIREWKSYQSYSLIIMLLNYRSTAKDQKESQIHGD